MYIYVYIYYYYSCGIYNMLRQIQSFITILLYSQESTDIRNLHKCLPIINWPNIPSFTVQQPHELDPLYLFHGNPMFYSPILHLSHTEWIALNDNHLYLHFNVQSVPLCANYQIRTHLLRGDPFYLSRTPHGLLNVSHFH